MKFFLLFDQQLFLLINHLPHNAFLNGLAMIVSGVGTAGIIWFLLGLWLFFREERKDLRFAFRLGVLALAIWGLVEELIKPMIARSRPSLWMEAIIVGGRPASFSFPSGHAAIAWAMVVPLSQKEPKLRWFFYALATLISFSRVYLGVHFPLDVIAGGFLGWALGLIINQRVFSRKKSP